MLWLGLDIGGTRVKAALLRDGWAPVHHVTRPYRLPTSQALVELIREAIAEMCADRCASREIAAIGLSVPGVLDERRTRVLYSANLPALQELSMAALAATALEGAPWLATTDQIAAASDYVAERQVRGRLLAISIGTGVGAAVLDVDATDPLGRPLLVNGDSPGHLGQIDVSLDAEAPVGPDGGAGSLEAYIGAPALGGRDPQTLCLNDPPMRALARALRIGHALYRPNEIALLGGIGIRLAHLANALHERVADRLTRLARPGWRLGFGTDDFHAARGAARLAGAMRRTPE